MHALRSWHTRPPFTSMPGTQPRILAHYGRYAYYCTLFTGLYDSCIPIVEMSGICQYINVYMDICMYGYIHLETVFPCPSASSPDQGQGTPFGSGSAFPSPSSVSSLGTPFTFHFRLGNLTRSGSDFLNVHIFLAFNGVFEYI